jgi:hypothetical protein
MLVSDVLIIPVEYSDVIVRAPSTAITSWPISSPIRLPKTASARALASAEARSAAVAAPVTWAASAALNSTPTPTHTMIITSRVQ